MPTKIDIYNLALSNIGQASIILGENSSISRKCDQLWQISLDEVIKLSLPNWCKKYLVPSGVDGYTKLNGWNYAFYYPDDAVRIARLIHKNDMDLHGSYDNDGYYSPSLSQIAATTTLPFRIGVENDNRVIYASHNAPVIEYYSNNISELLYTQPFADAVAWIMSSRLYASQKGYSLKEFKSMRAIAQSYISTCRAEEGNEGETGESRNSIRTGGYFRRAGC